VTSTLVDPCSSIKIPSFVFNVLASVINHLAKASAGGHQRTAPWPPRGAPRASAEKAWLIICGLNLRI